MKSFSSAAPSFISGKSNIKDVTYYNNDINTESYKNICGNCKIDDDFRTFHCHLSDLSSKMDEKIDIMIITESWDEKNGFSLNTQVATPEEERSFIDPVYMERLAQTINFGMDRLHDRHPAEEWKEAPSTVNICFNVAIKCPSVRKLQDIGVKSLNACASYIHAEIELLKPANIIVFGSLAAKAVLKKGQFPKLLGKSLKTEIGNHKCNVGVMPAVENLRVSIPEIQTNIFSILNSFFIKEKDYKSILKSEFGVNVMVGMAEPDLESIKDCLNNITSPYVAVDIETAGLNFLEDAITSISLSFLSGKDKVAVAIDAETMMREDFAPIIKNVLANPRLIKVFHNAQFDMKFLKREGFPVEDPISDTKILAHLSNENEPKNLLFLTKKYFPGVL